MYAWNQFSLGCIGKDSCGMDTIPSLSLSAVIINLNLRLQFCGEAGLSLLLILLAVKDEKIELGM